MKEIRLREALFRVDPIKNVVGETDRMAFRVVVTKGDTVGRFGPVAVAVPLYAGNDSPYETASGAVEGRRRSWLQRLRTALR
jgi:hypothetical protein